MKMTKGAITSKHETTKDYDKNYRLIYFAEYDCFYSRGIILPEDSPIDIEWLRERVITARGMITKKFGKTIFCYTDKDCPETLVKEALLCC
jgi:hypothetical protein